VAFPKASKLKPAFGTNASNSVRVEALISHTEAFNVTSQSICIIKRLVERTRQEVTWDRLFFRYSDITQYPYQIRGPQNQKRVPFRIQADFVFGYEEDDPNSNRDFKTLFESKHVNMQEKEGLTEDDVRVLLLDIEQYASKLKFNKRLSSIMYEYSKFDNEVLRRQLSKTTPNKLNIGFGLDVNKIKGVNNFPIYYETDGFKSNVRANVDSIMFTNNSNKYEVPKLKHTTIGIIRPDLFSDRMDSSHARHTNTRVAPGKISSFYGLPLDKTIVLENPTAQAQGKMTENKFKINQLRKSVRDGSLPPEFDNIFNGSDSSSGAMHVDAESDPIEGVGRDDLIIQEEQIRRTLQQMDRPSHSPSAQPIPRPRRPQVNIVKESRKRAIEVIPAFRSSSTDLIIREAVEDVAQESQFKYPEIKRELRSFRLANSDHTRDILPDDRNYFNELLQMYNLEVVPDDVISIGKYLKAINKIMKPVKNTVTEEPPQKKKKEASDKRKRAKSTAEMSTALAIRTAQLVEPDSMIEAEMPRRKKAWGEKDKRD
jgi:hypothetical protein